MADLEEIIRQQEMTISALRHRVERLQDIKRRAIVRRKKLQARVRYLQLELETRPRTPGKPLEPLG